MSSFKQGYIKKSELPPLEASLIDESVRERYSNTQGYYRSRGLPPRAALNQLPLFDFFEPTHNPSHKKCPILLKDGEEEIKGHLLNSEFDSLLGLYKGTLATQRSVVAEAFQWYSTLVSIYYIHLARYSREFNVEANTDIILSDENIPASVKLNLRIKLIALRYVAFNVYEGYGLSGYSPTLWVFFCLITGQGTYTLPSKSGKEVSSFISEEEARTLSIALKDAESEYLAQCVEGEIPFSEITNGALQLFRQQWLKLDSDVINLSVPDPSDSSKSISIGESIIKELYNAWALTNIYRQLERGLNVTAPQSDIQLAVLAGFVRRSAKGRILNTKSSLIDMDFSSLYLDDKEKAQLILSFHSQEDPEIDYSMINLFSHTSGPVPLFGYLQEYWETRDQEFSTIQLKSRLRDYNGALIPFGMWVEDTYQMTKDRLRAIREIAYKAKVLESAQGQEVSTLINEWLSNGATFRI